MQEKLIQSDLWILHLFNQKMTAEWLDLVVPILTDLHKNPIFVWVFAILALGFSVFRWGWARTLFFTLSLATVFSLTDAFSGQVLKPFFQRERPDVAGVEVVLRCPHFSGGSFPSNHSANVAALAGFTAAYNPALLWVTGPLAIAGGYFRVYCGVHYPSDVLAGWLYGLLVGLLVGWLSRAIYRRLKQNPPTQKFFNR